MSGNSAKRVLAYSVMRVVACAAIVVLHTVNVAELLYKDKISGTQDMVSLIVVYCMMWAVPCFVMVSGALLLDPEREVSISKIYQSYVLRALGALIFFGLAFRIFDCVMNRESFSIATIGDAFGKIFTGKSWSHLWYLYVLLGLYLILPLYRALTRTAEPVVLRYLLLIFCLFLSLLPLTKCFGVTSRFDIPISGIYTLYFFAGYALSEKIIRIPRPVGALLFGIGLAATIGVSVLRFRLAAESLDPLINSYSSPFVVLQSIGVYACIVGDAQRGDGNRLIEFLDANSFGIYLLHMVFLRLVLRYFGFNPYTAGEWSFALLVVGNLVLSCIVTWLLRQIPGLKRML